MKPMICRMAIGSWERAELASWTIQATMRALKMPGISDVVNGFLDVCPTPVARNRAVLLARANKCDVLCCVDADTLPHPDFLEAALLELRTGQEDKVVVCPCVCTGDTNHVQVFRWGTRQDATDDDQLGRLEYVSREESARLQGREEVACAGAGAFVCHTRVFDRIAPPWFDYEYTDDFRATLASTEDIRCFRDLSLAGVKFVCLWSHWATHYKTIALVRPVALTVGDVNERYRRFMLQEAARKAPTSLNETS